MTLVTTNKVKNKITKIILENSWFKLKPVITKVERKTPLTSMVELLFRETKLNIVTAHSNRYRKFE